MSRPATPELPFATPAIDEMNLVEIPFALMVRSTTQRTLLLSPDGEDRLVAADAVGGLPTALGERVLVALLYFHKKFNGFHSPRVRLPLRAFISEYLYPDRSYRPSAQAYDAVQEQLRRIAHTRIVSSRWYDKSLGRHIEIDASIIDYIKVIEDGGGNRAKVLEIRWGELFFNSLKARYTKALDYQLWLRLERPLTRRLYRWLDRQLHTKRSETVRAWQFGRFKLGLTHKRIAAPSRRGSNYLVKELAPCVEELNQAGFPVALTVDSAEDDFALTFSRILDETPDEREPQRILDPVTELLDYFNRVAHGLESARSYAPQDRVLASSWIETYGLEAAQLLVDACLQTCRRGGHAKPFKFRRLAYYEDAAAGLLDRAAAERQGQLPLMDSSSPPPVAKVEVPSELVAFNQAFFTQLTAGVRAALQPLAYVCPAPPELLFHSLDPSPIGFFLVNHRAALLKAAQAIDPTLTQLRLNKD